ncbi:hypothetical protein [Flavihumibacter solisilvae]|uniref:Alpha-L-arabinofuranosidase n=1 Tax=Flavihumibacter solisilvae TaxID=1349421 RepID=A0A0C1LGK0_9BACT|nr:hypothetical protein [Flavihumibacter solisilvae]KIC94453.1 hypothetical protein OI18_11860 [Flavihumibacter solisilvae]
MKQITMKTTMAVLFASSLVIVSCSGKDDDKKGGGGTDENEVPATIGFFQDDWTEKRLSVPVSFTEVPAITDQPDHVVAVYPGEVITKIPNYLFGENANLTTTQYVTEPELVSNINDLDPSIIRYPGGSNSNLFFWNAADGERPADVPATLFSGSGASFTPQYYFGKSDKPETFSVDNYYSLLSQTSSKGMITVNYSYARYSTAPNPVAAAAHLAADWVRYDNGRTKYWEIGNENYGNWQAGYQINTADNKDGQPATISADVYGSHVKVFVDSMRKAATEIGKSIYIGAVLMEGEYATSTDVERQWNVKTIQKVHNLVDFYSTHNYYTPFNTNSNSSYILYTVDYSTKVMQEYINQSFKSAGVSAKPIALSQFNINAVGAGQAPSFVNGMHSVMTQCEMLKNKLAVAARWTLTDTWDNGDSQGMFSMGDEPANPDKWTPRPVFYYQHFFRKILGDRMVKASTTSPTNDIAYYATTYSKRDVGMVIVNKQDNNRTIKIDLKNWGSANKVFWYTLQGGGDNGEFSRKVIVNGEGPEGDGGGPTNFKTIAPYTINGQSEILVKLPPRGMIFMGISCEAKP